MSEGKLVYLAGPMSGKPDFNYPAFNEAARSLRSRGWKILNPAELDGGSQDKSWNWYIENSLREMREKCNEMILLPGWEGSNGVVNHELPVAVELCFRFHLYEGGKARAVTLNELNQRLERSQKLDKVHEEAMNDLAKCIGVDPLKATEPDEVERLKVWLAGDVKPSNPCNPKDICGSNKIPLHLWPETATAMGSMALLYGALLYGRSNWRAVGVRATIYTDACKRHVNKWLEGESDDPDSGLPHLAHALACLAILIDSQAAGNLNDDRMYPGGYAKLVDELTPHVQRLKEKYAERSPKHYAISDKGGA